MKPAYTVTFLEMTERPKAKKPEFDVLHASPIPPAYFRAMYTEAGRKYHWIDQLRKPESEFIAYCNDNSNEMVSLIHDGAPAGFFVLNRCAKTVELVYFALLDDAIGKGLGGKWLDFALDEAWTTQGCEKVILDTCTLDHPRALPLYISKGFVITHTEDRPQQS